MRVVVAVDPAMSGRDLPTIHVGRPSPLSDPFPAIDTTQGDDPAARYAAWLDEQLARPDSPAARELALLRLILAEHGALALVCWQSSADCCCQTIRDRLLERR